MSETVNGAEYFQKRSGVRTYEQATMPDGSVTLLRSLFAEERSDINMMWRDDNFEDVSPDAAKNRAALIMCRSIVDAEHNPIFTGTDEEMKIFRNLPSVDADALDEVIRKLSYGKSRKLGKNLPAATPNAS